MASLPKVAAVSQELPPAGPQQREPHLFRFGLRRLFLFLSMATVLAAALARVGGPWPVVIGCLAGLVMAHVFGTFVGTRLRDTSRDVQLWKARPGSPDRDEPVALPQPVRICELNLPSTTPLAGFEKVGQWRYVCVAMGVGAAAGCLAITAALGDHVTWAGLGMGAISCGGLGAGGAVLAVNAWLTARQAWRQATRDPAKSDDRAVSSQA
jgi:hypothetical protein